MSCREGAVLHCTCVPLNLSRGTHPHAYADLLICADRFRKQQLKDVNIYEMELLLITHIMFPEEFLIPGTKRQCSAETLNEQKDKDCVLAQRIHAFENTDLFDKIGVGV